MPLDNSKIWYHTYMIKDGSMCHDPKDYDVMIDGVWDHNPYAEEIMANMKEVEGRTILDAGTCTGFFSCLFEKMGAISFSSDLCDRKERQDIKAELGQEDRFIHQNIYNLYNFCSFANTDLIANNAAGMTDSTDFCQRFDYVWCQDVFCHLEHPILALRNLREICNKKIFIATDRFECHIDSAKTYFQAEWHNTNQQSICHYHNNVYTYSYSETFMKRILVDCGFKSPNIKFSYFTPAGKRNPTFIDGDDLTKVGNPTEEEMKSIGRWVDVYEAEVDLKKRGFPKNKMLDFII
jgi:SAM-dependent methyltransferase